MGHELTTQIVLALIAASVALATTSLTLQWDRRKWRTELKTSYALELYRTRLKSYPKASETMRRISAQGPEQLTTDLMHEVAQALNDWAYSEGGLCAGENTRGAILVLRDRLLSARDNRPPEDLYRVRNTALLYLRRDLDLKGLDYFDPGIKINRTLLDEVGEELP